MLLEKGYINIKLKSFYRLAGFDTNEFIIPFSKLDLNKIHNADINDNTVVTKNELVLFQYLRSLIPESYIMDGLQYNYRPEYYCIEHPAYPNIYVPHANGFWFCTPEKAKDRLWVFGTNYVVHGNHFTGGRLPEPRVIKYKALNMICRYLNKLIQDKDNKSNIFKLYRYGRLIYTISYNSSIYYNYGFKVIKHHYKTENKAEQLNSYEQFCKDLTPVI